MEQRPENSAVPAAEGEKDTPANRLAYAIEVAISQSRWLIIPYLFGLIVGVGALLVTFALKLGVLLGKVGSGSEDEIIVGVLKLVDVFLTANLLMIVVGASYMNAVSRIFNEANWPPSLIGIGFSNLKQKLLGSIMAIAAVSALEWFMDIDRNVESAKLIWVVAILLAFAIAMLMLSVADRISEGGKHEK